MWKQWKKKIARLFFTEVMEEEEVEQKPRDINSLHDQNVHTKITHKYPNRNSFRFPVIPDKPNRSEIEKPAFERKHQNNDQPAYARKANRREGPATHQRMNRNEQSIREHGEQDVTGQTRKEQDTAEDKKQQESGNKKPLVEKKPFQPTDVPSPIYGFQKRKQEKEIAEIPAYVRKQQADNGDDHSAKKEEHESQPLSQKEDETPPPQRIEQDQAESLTSENHTKNQEEQEQVSLPGESLEETFSEYESPIQSEEISEMEQVEETAASEEPVKKKNPIHSTRNQRTAKERASNQAEPNNQQSNQTIPFNVMMSANDKRAYSERKRLSNDNRSTAPAKAAIPYHLLNDPVPKNSQDQLWVANQQELLEKTLKYFHVKATVVRATQGPSVTRFEVQPEMGVKVSKIKNLSDDLKLNMAAKDIRIEAPIPGKNTVGIEIPNSESQMVGLQEIFATDTFQNNPSPLTIALGLTIEGSPSITTIKKMPHGLIAGATGSGKSVCINTILVSLIYKASHHDVKFMLIDPKMVELAPFNNIPHLVAPVITDVKAATQALKWAVNEMEDRYEKFVEEGVRDIERYNQKMVKQNRPADKMPFLVIVIDELADLMMVSPQDVEDAICRIAQKARACGIHLLLATQRPSVDVITGLIKANIPTRIAFSVSSQVDSRTIIDTNGAEKLLGKGDMLFIENGAGKSVRLQGAFVSDEEIERVTKYARSIATPEYDFEQDDLLEQIAVDDNDEDDLLESAIAFVVEQNNASTSLLQRHFKIGYNRAARLMDTMEMKGIIAQQNGSKPREVLISSSQLSGQD